MLAYEEVADPSEHLPLIYRVINQMGIADREEAFSEGLVAITVAAQEFDPARGVPLANWLGKNIRWSLQNWQQKNRRRASQEAPHEISRAVVHNVMESEQDVHVGASTLKFMQGAGRDSVVSLENHIALREAFAKISEILDELERNVLLLHALSWPGIKIAKHLGISPVAVTRTKARAQKKMREALLK